MNISGVPKEMLETPAVQNVMNMLKEQFSQMFQIIDNEVVPKVMNDIPEGMESVILPSMKIQYANLIQMAFNEVYQDYINRATFDFAHGAMFGGTE